MKNINNLLSDINKSRIANLIDRLQPSETVVLFGTAIIVGAGTGLGAVFFIWLIGQVQTFLFQTVGFSIKFPRKGTVHTDPHYRRTFGGTHHRLLCLRG